MSLLINRRGRIRTRNPKVARPGLTCGFFVRTHDASVWAISIRNGRPRRAVGPLSPSEVEWEPVQLDFRSRGIDARAFDLREFSSVKSGPTWERFGPQPPKPLKPMNEPGESRRRSGRVMVAKP